VDRNEALRRIRDGDRPWDLLVVGGGATGMGAAVDAASRGYRTLLVEAHDFGHGTSSRSTKLIHGGVRYLQQGNVTLVMEALHERTLLRRNAPHLVHDLPFVVPTYDWWQGPFYGVGLRIYDLLAGRHGFGRSRALTREQTLARLPGIEPSGLRGGVVYHDGQFDDARLVIHLARTAWREGGTLLNYARVTGLLKSGGIVTGATVRDEESGDELRVPARCVINATGVFADGLRRIDDPETMSLLRPSQGVHLVLERSFLPGNAAIMVPHTDDGRVLFLIPWLDRLLVGTTDTAVGKIVEEPRATRAEIDFLLEHVGRYLVRDPGPDDVLSVFAGLRPLVDGGEATTAALSRDHVVHVSSSGLVTVVGGKWTTYRRMGQDAVDQAAVVADLAPEQCVTAELRIHGAVEGDTPPGPHGADRGAVEAVCAEREGWAEPIVPGLAVRRGDVAWAARYEMARSVDDVLARRTRSLLLDARASAEAATPVAEVLAAELGRDEAWAAAQAREFAALAAGYRVA
jgi:glycerol-3-phosphate dehydrogenase